MIWPMVPLALLIHFNIPGKVHTLRSEAGTKTTILLIGHEVFDVQVGRDTHLRWSQTDDYPFAVQRYHLLVQRLVECAWVSMGLSLTLALMFFSKQSVDNPSDSATWPPWRTLFICFSVAALLVVAFQCCIWPLIAGRRFALENVGDDSSYVRGFLSLLILCGRTWLLAPVCEELLFRTCFQKVLASFFGPWVAVGILGVGFGYWHSFQGLAGVIQLTLVGLLSGVMYFKTGRLWVSVAFHSMVNICGSPAAFDWLFA